MADELIQDEHGLESDPIATEQAAYAYLLIGADQRATDILEVLVQSKGRGWPGEAEISDDEIHVLQERPTNACAHAG